MGGDLWSCCTKVRYSYMIFRKSSLLVSCIIPLVVLTSPRSTLTPVGDDIVKVTLNSSSFSLTTLSFTTGIVTVTLVSPVLNVAVSGVAS